MRAELELKQVLSVVSSYIDSNGTLLVFLSVGKFPVKLLGLYINDTPYTPYNIDCRVSFNGSSASISSEPFLPPLSLSVIICPNIDASSARVKVVYEGGEVETYA